VLKNITCVMLLPIFLFFLFYILQYLGYNPVIVSFVKSPPCDISVIIERKLGCDITDKGVAKCTRSKKVRAVQQPLSFLHVWIM